MDNVIIQTGFMKNLIGRTLSRIVSKKFEDEVDIKVNSVRADTSIEKKTAHMHLDIDIYCGLDALSRILQTLM